MLLLLLLLLLLRDSAITSAAWRRIGKASTLLLKVRAWQRSLAAVLKQGVRRGGWLLLLLLLLLPLSLPLPQQPRLTASARLKQ